LIESLKNLYELSSSAVVQLGSLPGDGKSGVEEDATSMIRCSDWRLTAQNRKVWGQKLMEATGG
jgi:hypothetical protein